LKATSQIEIEEGNAPTDPNAPADFVAKTTVQRPEFAAAGGDVGGYNRGWLDPGNHVMRVNGEAAHVDAHHAERHRPPPARPTRSTRRPAPRLPACSARAPRKRAAFDNMEARSAGERCIVSFGRNGGPPMFANGFYNNNYQIVQTPDHVVINGRDEP
jgi:hypothetical protein